jgi:hypothetical protein
MGYVYSKELGTDEEGIELSFDIFKESNTEYRPILTATSDHNMGFSRRRSFESQQDAMNFYLENKSALIKEAKRTL